MSFQQPGFKHGSEVAAADLSAKQYFCMLLGSSGYNVLVLAEHNNSALNPATLNAVAAALELSDKVDILVAGAQCSAAAEAAAKVAGIGKVLVADAAHFDNALAENVAPLIVKLAESYSHILAAATTTGKNIMPRAAALMDVAQISEIVAVESESRVAWISSD